MCCGPPSSDSTPPSLSVFFWIPHKFLTDPFPFHIISQRPLPREQCDVTTAPAGSLAQAVQAPSGVGQEL